MVEKLQKLVAARIQLLPALQIGSHFVLERDGFVALVERKDEGFGAIGTAGLLTMKGPAPLVWRGNDPWFVTKSFEQPATDEQVASLRAFQVDLQGALA